MFVIPQQRYNFFRPNFSDPCPRFFRLLLLPLFFPSNPILWLEWIFPPVFPTQEERFAAAREELKVDDIPLPLPICNIIFYFDLSAGEGRGGDREERRAALMSAHSAAAHCKTCNYSSVYLYLKHCLTRKICQYATNAFICALKLNSLLQAML